ncbi:hypothetical protein VTK26DRAFT_3309 [Humicola hyalothermophila]
MNDSVLGPFVASVTASPDEAYQAAVVDTHDYKQGLSRLWSPKDSASEESGRSPRVGFLPMLSIPWTSESKSSASSSSDTGDRGLTDDSANTPSPTGNEPMTPPTTPPTSDWGFSTSPGGGLHKALSVHSNGWKKMGAKLGFGRMGRNKRGHSTSVTSAAPDLNVSASDTSQERRKTSPL